MAGTETSNTKQMAIRFPKPLLAQVEAYAAENGKTAREAIVSLLTRSLSGASQAHPDLNPGGTDAASQMNPGVADRLASLEAMMGERLAELADRVAALEASPPVKKERPAPRPVVDRPRPSAPVSADDDGWLTVRQAFEALGGVPGDPESVVRALDGRPNKWLSFKTNGKNPEYFPRFGLVVDLDRKAAHRPWLRLAEGRQ